VRSVEETIEFLRADTQAALRHYGRKPADFVRDVLRAEPTQDQAEVMQAVADARAGRLDKTRFAVKSGTGVGKTTMCSWLILWHLAVFKDSKVPCTAPTSPQIKAVLWPELRKWVNDMPNELAEAFPYEVTVDTCRLCIDNFAVARTAQKEKPEAFQGFHANNIMLIADEASGIPDEIFDAGQGVMSEEGAILFMVGNPTRPFGFFYDAFHNDRGMYWTKTISCVDNERVTDGYVEDTKAKYGEDSFQYQVRVLGEFYLEDDDIIIPRSWCEAAVKRGEDIKVDGSYVSWGFDPSDGGRDAGALAKRQGNTLLEPVTVYAGLTSDRQVDRVVEEFFASNNKPNEIVVDAIGVGANVMRTLKRKIGDKVRVKPVYVGTKPTDERYTSYRVELWGRGRQWVKSSFSVMPPDEELIRELSGVVWEISERTGKYRIPDKKVGGKSPNRADAFLLTFHSRAARDTSVLTSDRQYKTMKQYTKGQGSASWLN